LAWVRVTFTRTANVLLAKTTKFVTNAEVLKAIVSIVMVTVAQFAMMAIVQLVVVQSNVRIAMALEKVWTVNKFCHFSEYGLIPLDTILFLWYNNSNTQKENGKCTSGEFTNLMIKKLSK
jgi:hypothetical protein